MELTKMICGLYMLSILVLLQWIEQKTRLLVTSDSKLWFLAHNLDTSSTAIIIGSDVIESS